MSGGAVYRRVLGHLAERGCVQRQVMQAVEAGNVGALRELSYDLGREAGLDRETLLDRAAGVFLLFACTNLTDDLQDGDAHRYLEVPSRDGPAVEIMLLSLSFDVLSRSGLDATSLGRVAIAWTELFAGQLDEVSGRAWTADRYIEIGDRIAGLQYATYLMVMWHGTELAHLADRVGRAIGFAAHVAEDLRSGDKRLVGLSKEGRDRVIEVAKERRAWLAGVGLRATARAAITLRFGDSDAA